MIDPNHADALHLMGLLSFDAGECDLAIEWIACAIRQDPNAEYLKHLGAVLLKLGRDHEALLSYQQALQLSSGDFEAASKSGVLLQRQGRWEEALAHLNLCVALQPNHAPILNQRAIAHRGVGNQEGYLSDSLRAHALDPADAESCNNAGDAMLSLGREEEALAWFDKALSLSPDNPTILTNKAQAISQCRRLDEAAAIYSRVRSIAPHHAMAEWNLALLKLLTGDFAAGWAGRAARWKIPSLSAGYPKFPQPMWRAEPVASKTILIHVDEGLGDTIQFARYAPMLAARGARVLLVVADPLQPLLSGLPGVAQCLRRSAGGLPDFDMHCPFSNLPLNFATRLDSIPAATSYLPQPEPERIKAWDERLPPRRRPRIGLVWSGSHAHRNDRNRSLPLQLLARILDADATFVSLQKDPRPRDSLVLAERSEIIDLTAQLTDFAETAALVACLDLVVTVDTSIAHLAAALGRPTWIMLPSMPDYRWLLDRDDSPWYPTVRLFRQDAARDYAPVVDRIRAALAGFEPMNAAAGNSRHA